jgi:alanine dehydrogenase
MIIGVPRETHRHEHRVGLNPFAVSRLTRQGHQVLIERAAGEEARFADRDYENQGGKIVFSTEEIYGRADVVARVGTIATEELDALKRGSIICGFQHLAIAPRKTVDRLMELEATLIGYEIIRDRYGDLPVLIPFSEMAGQMAVTIAAYYLQNEEKGRGILMGNVTGVPPPTVLILGAGTAGHSAARQALASGAHVIVLDADLRKLRRINHELAGKGVTAVPGMDRLERYTTIADVVIGAILIPGGRAPFLVTEGMIKAMKPGSVVIDVSIDQGGCIETSRPTTIADPTFIVHDVVHYCVPNMTANVARTASRALANAALPYLMELAARGLEPTLRENPDMADGVYLYRGRMVNPRVAETHAIPAAPLATLLDKAGDR